MPFLSPTVRPLWELQSEFSRCTGSRLKRRLVKMQVGFYPGGVLWWNDWNQGVKKLILKKKKNFLEKGKKEPLIFFLEVFNGVKFNYRILNCTVHFQDLSPDLWGIYSVRWRLMTPDSHSGKGWLQFNGLVFKNMVLIHYVNTADFVNWVL